MMARKTTADTQAAHHIGSRAAHQLRPDAKSFCLMTDRFGLIELALLKSSTVNKGLGFRV